MITIIWKVSRVYEKWMNSKRYFFFQECFRFEVDNFIMKSLLDLFGSKIEEQIENFVAFVVYSMLYKTKSHNILPGYPFIYFCKTQRSGHMI